MPQKYSDFGLKARSVMLQKGIKMNDIAKEMNVCYAYVSDLLKGVRANKERLKQIAKILEIDEKEIQ